MYEINHGSLCSPPGEAWKHAYQGLENPAGSWLLDAYGLRVIGESSLVVFETAKQIMKLCKAATSDAVRIRSRQQAHFMKRIVLLEQRYTRLSDCLTLFSSSLSPTIGRQGRRPVNWLTIIRRWYSSRYIIRWIGASYVGT